MGWFLGLGMLPTGTFSSPASASSVVEVRDLHHEVRLGMLINLVYNMHKSWLNSILVQRFCRYSRKSKFCCSCIAGKKKKALFIEL